jgi:hypothetical protein
MMDSYPKRGCLWPMWPHESRPTHQYCGRQRAMESSYCAEHRAMSIRDFEQEPRQPFVPHKVAA